MEDKKNMKTNRTEGAISKYSWNCRYSVNYEHNKRLNAKTRKCQLYLDTAKKSLKAISFHLTGIFTQYVGVIMEVTHFNNVQYGHSRPFGY